MSANEIGSVVVHSKYLAQGYLNATDKDILIFILINVLEYPVFESEKEDM